MRISDWSSDVCSSDLVVDLDPAGPVDRPHLQITTDSYIDKSNYRNTAFRKERRPASDAARSSEAPAAGGSDGAKSETSGQTDRHGHGVAYISRSMALKLMQERSEERATGKGCVSTCVSGGWRCN